MKLNTMSTIGAVIRYLRDIYPKRGGDAFCSSEDWFIYTAGEDGEFRLDTPCCISARPDYDDERGVEIFPSFAEEHGMYCELMPETLEDVVAAVLDQKRCATEEDLLRALNYYADEDGFLQF